MSNLIGQSLGRYHILEQLGEGGMATVFKAYDTRLEREVAIKVIRSDAFPPNQLERILKRFEREAKALAKLSHPHIIKVIDYGEYEGSPYLVMEYMPGGTLKQRLGKPMPWQEAVRILIPIAEALEYAHEQRIIHRDIKPSNILLTQKGQPMLTDFGIAKILETEETATLTGTGIGVGTPEYMAPEQWTGQSTLQSDIYSLGIMFYEMVTGRKPYTADTPAAILLKQANEALPRPGKFATDLPQRAENVLLKALAKNPKDRYRNMGEFAKALEGLTSGKTADKKPDATPAREKRAEIRLPVIPRRTVITVGLIALGIGLVAVLLPSMKSLPATLFPRAVSSNTPMPEFTSTPKNAPTPIITVAPAATNTPPISPTPTLGIGSTWVRPADRMEMVYVPEGEFTMGSNDGDGDEKPAHQVYLDAYWIDRTEVTNAMYALCVLAGPCKSNPGSSVRSSEYDNHPVTGMGWDDAHAYCIWTDARLPTEAEWEKAARGTDGRIYPWGNGKDPAKYYIISNGNTEPVGSYPSGASLYGVLDMTGSVPEWVSDWHNATYYQNSPSSNPQGPAYGEQHVLRSSRWNRIESFARADGHFSIFSSDVNIFGFRCARSISP